MALPATTLGVAAVVPRVPSRLDETFERFDFNHPIYILYSSGTTGKPKCITHGTGNVLIEHNKDLQESMMIELMYYQLHLLLQSDHHYMMYHH